METPDQTSEKEVPDKEMPDKELSVQDTLTKYTQECLTKTKLTEPELKAFFEAYLSTVFLDSGKQPDFARFCIRYAKYEKELTLYTSKCMALFGIDLTKKIVHVHEGVDVKVKQLDEWITSLSEMPFNAEINPVLAKIQKVDWTQQKLAEKIVEINAVYVIKQLTYGVEILNRIKSKKAVSINLLLPLYTFSTDYLDHLIKMVETGEETIYLATRDLILDSLKFITSNIEGYYRFMVEHFKDIPNEQLERMYKHAVSTKTTLRTLLTDYTMTPMTPEVREEVDHVKKLVVTVRKDYERVMTMERKWIGELNPGDNAAIQAIDNFFNGDKLDNVSLITLILMSLGQLDGDLEVVVPVRRAAVKREMEDAEPILEEAVASDKEDKPGTPAKPDEGMEKSTTPDKPGTPDKVTDKVTDKPATPDKVTDKVAPGKPGTPDKVTDKPVSPAKPASDDNPMSEPELELSGKEEPGRTWEDTINDVFGVPFESSKGDNTQDPEDITVLDEAQTGTDENPVYPTDTDKAKQSEQADATGSDKAKQSEQAEATGSDKAKQSEQDVDPTKTDKAKQSEQYKDPIKPIERESEEPAFFSSALDKLKGLFGTRDETINGPKDEPLPPPKVQSQVEPTKVQVKAQVQPVQPQLQPMQQPQLQPQVQPVQPVQQPQLQPQVQPVQPQVQPMQPTQVPVQPVQHQVQQAQTQLQDKMKEIKALQEKAEQEKIRQDKILQETLQKQRSDFEKRLKDQLDTERATLDTKLRSQLNSMDSSSKSFETKLKAQADAQRTELEKKLKAQADEARATQLEMEKKLKAQHDQARIQREISDTATKAQAQIERTALEEKLKAQLQAQQLALDTKRKEHEDARRRMNEKIEQLEKQVKEGTDTSLEGIKKELRNLLLQREKDAMERSRPYLSRGRSSDEFSDLRPRVSSDRESSVSSSVSRLTQDGNDPSGSVSSKDTEQTMRSRLQAGSLSHSLLIPPIKPPPAPSAPIVVPSAAPIVVPSSAPIVVPSSAPIVVPSAAPIVVPSAAPSAASNPSAAPSAASNPSAAPIVLPSAVSNPSAAPPAVSNPSAAPIVLPPAPSAGPQVGPLLHGLSSYMRQKNPVNDGYQANENSPNSYSRYAATPEGHPPPLPAPGVLSDRMRGYINTNSPNSMMSDLTNRTSSTHSQRLDPYNDNSPARTIGTSLSSLVSSSGSQPSSVVSNAEKKKIIDTKSTFIQETFHPHGTYVTLFDKSVGVPGSDPPAEVLDQPPFALLSPPAPPPVLLSPASPAALHPQPPAPAVAALPEPPPALPPIAPRSTVRPPLPPARLRTLVPEKDTDQLPIKMKMKNNFIQEAFHPPGTYIPLPQSSAERQVEPPAEPQADPSAERQSGPSAEPPVEPPAERQAEPPVEPPAQPSNRQQFIANTFEPFPSYLLVDHVNNGEEYEAAIPPQSSRLRNSQKMVNNPAQKVLDLVNRAERQSKQYQDFRQKRFEGTDAPELLQPVQAALKEVLTDPTFKINGLSQQHLAEAAIQAAKNADDLLRKTAGEKLVRLLKQLDFKKKINKRVKEKAKKIKEDAVRTILKAVKLYQSKPDRNLFNEPQYDHAIVPFSRNKDHRLGSIGSNNRPREATTRLPSSREEKPIHKRKKEKGMVVVKTEPKPDQSALKLDNLNKIWRDPLNDQIKRSNEIITKVAELLATFDYVSTLSTPAHPHEIYLIPELVQDAYHPTYVDTRADTPLYYLHHYHAIGVYLDGLNTLYQELLKITDTPEEKYMTGFTDYYFRTKQEEIDDKLLGMIENVRSNIAIYPAKVYQSREAELSIRKKALNTKITENMKKMKQMKYVLLKKYHVEIDNLRYDAVLQNILKKETSMPSEKDNKEGIFRIFDTFRQVYNKASKKMLAASRGFILRRQRSNTVNMQATSAPINPRGASANRPPTDTAQKLAVAVATRPLLADPLVKQAPTRPVVKNPKDPVEPTKPKTRVDTPRLQPEFVGKGTPLNKRETAPERENTQPEFIRGMGPRLNNRETAPGRVSPNTGSKEEILVGKPDNTTRGVPVIARKEAQPVRMHKGTDLNSGGLNLLPASFPGSLQLKKKNEKRRYQPTPSPTEVEPVQSLNLNEVDPFIENV